MYFMFLTILVLSSLANFYSEAGRFHNTALCKGRDIKQQATLDGHFRDLKKAVQKGDMDTLRALLAKRFDLSSTDEYGRTLLMVSIATADTNPEIVRLLLQKGSNVNTQDKLGTSPLILAAMFNHREVMDVLLDNGADIETRDIYGHSALMKAAMFSDPEITRMLLSMGSKVNAKDLSGATPLMLSREANVEALLSAGADIHAVDQAGCTAVMHAVSQGQLRKIETLINKGVDINAKSRNGKTALDMAIEKQFHSAINLLKQAGAKN